MNDAGFIVIHRKITGWRWYENTNVKVVFLHCLLKANYVEKEWENITIPRGSFISSYEKIGKDLGLNRSTVRRCINKLKATNEITATGSPRHTVFKVINYSTFQDKEKPTYCRTNGRTNGRTTTNKVNNINNTKGSFVKPTLEEVKSYCIERKNDVNPEKFFHYYESNGWKVGGKAPMKNWKSAICGTWEKKSTPKRVTEEYVNDNSE